MCKAFSGIIKENGDVLWEFGVDSHEKIISEHGLKDDGHPRDWARFEMAPENGNYLKPDKWAFRLDEGTPPSWWSEIHRAECEKAQKAWKKKLDKILVYKEIVHPFKDIKPPKKITKKHIDLLKQWTSVGTSVWASVWASVGDSVGDSVWASVWASVRDSVRDSVWASVRDSVWAYDGSFFTLPRSAWKYTENIKLPKGQTYPFQQTVDLWEMGLVPSFDGKLWRLHGGKDGKVLWAGKIERGK